jgi:hypothetical protein
VDWKWTVTAVLPVISLVLGAWLTQLNDQRRDDAQLRREERAHAVERDRQRQDRQEDFELTSLGELLSDITALLSEAMKLIRTRPGLTGEEAKDFNELSAKVTASSALVLDDDCRWAAQALRAKIYLFVGESHAHAGEPPDPQTILSLSRLHTELSEALARRIREIYINRSQPRGPRLRP